MDSIGDLSKHRSAPMHVVRASADRVTVRSAIDPAFSDTWVQPERSSCRAYFASIAWAGAAASKPAAAT